MKKEITVPYNYQPREYQLPILRAIDNGTKRAVLLWHRRAGKDKTILNLVVKKMIERVGIYYYFFPTYAQGKKILWDGIDGQGFKFLDHFPAQIITSKNSTEMKITLLNNSLFQIVGTDNYDSIVGTNPVGCVFSEFALQDPIAWDYVRPILRENGGWAIFPFTPRGYNHGWDIYNIAESQLDWFCQKLTIDDTRAMTSEDMAAERRDGMSEPMIQQEFYCSFEQISGVAFGELSKAIHMIDVNNPPDRLRELFDFKKMQPKGETKVFRSLDWGYTAPFSANWYFADYDGRLYMYREMYGSHDHRDIGIQMPARIVAKKIQEYEQEHEISPLLCVADASIWDKPSNQNEKAEKLPSIAETMAEEGVYFDRETSIDAKKSRLQGKHQLHERLRVDDDGLPGFFVFSNCTHWWRTVPMLPLDPLKIEDVDTDSADHCYDSTRYMLSARPYKSIKKAWKDPMSADELIRKYFPNDPANARERRVRT